MRTLSSACTPRARLGIVTAKRRGTVELAFRALPLAHLFDTVVGERRHRRAQAVPGGILLALERLGAEPDDAAYVGDSPYDMGAAKAAGVFAVAVTWGGIHPRERSRRGAGRRRRRPPDELLAVL